MNEKIRLLKESEKPAKIEAHKLVQYELKKGPHYTLNQFTEGNKSKLHVVLKRNLIVNGF